MSGKRIENDEQLQNSLKWLLEKAKEMDHPLMDGQAKAELMVKYDFVSERVQEYQQERAKLMAQAQKDSEVEPDNPTIEPPQEPQQQQKPVNLSAWLDD